jgi:3-deoxy-D-manno-octulosonate 8-phosphate phosphatase (KDO 8-P phosphatase)
MDVQQICQPIDLLLADVDGVLTDGRILLDSRGVEIKQFHIRDGMGIRLWQKAGYGFGLITARSSQTVRMRAAELGIEIIRQGREDKGVAVRELLGELNVEPERVCYVGDDLLDLPAVGQVGLSVAVADACPELRRAAHFVTAAPGGRGAVREAIETILKAQGRWDELVAAYLR